VTPLRLSPAAQLQLRCPVCRAPLGRDGDAICCGGEGCRTTFPVVDGIPVLINEARSLFALEDFAAGRATTFELRKNPFIGALKRLLPGIDDTDDLSRRNYAAFARLLSGQAGPPRVLVLGGSILGSGMEELARAGRLELVESDVSFGPRTALVCDAHDVPFADGSFDGVILQAVLEHVVDPVRCVAEAHRVLAPHGLVYAETPFMQQVHLGPYDFARFTHLGHRRLLRNFAEIDSGVRCGPGMALAWSWQYFLLSFSAARPWRAAARLVGRCTAFPLKYFDGFLAKRPGAYDAASGFYFLGRKSDQPLADRELVRSYRGAVGIG
jgi:SAM-dependent methyltransferase